MKQKKDNGIWKIFIRKKSVKERCIDILMGFGVSGGTFWVLTKTSAFSGAAATTSSLAFLGPFGMVAGICSLGVLMAVGFCLRPFYNFCKETKKLNKKKRRKNRKFFK